MKTFFWLLIYLFIAGSKISGQCAQPGLKIESQDCVGPKDLLVQSVTCSKMDVKWTGNKKQSYTVKALYTDPLTKVVHEAMASQAVCNGDGACAASISVKEGTVTSWSVQAICTIENANFYSSEVEGADTYIPLCTKMNESPGKRDSISTQLVHVYPNPSTGYLTVEYFKNTGAATRIRIFDETGQQVYSRMEGANTRFRLDLKNLVNGIYLLELNSGKDISAIKFELFRK